MNPLLARAIELSAEQMERYADSSKLAEDFYAEKFEIGVTLQIQQLLAAVHQEQNSTTK